MQGDRTSCSGGICGRDMAEMLAQARIDFAADEFALALSDGVSDTTLIVTPGEDPAQGCDCVSIPSGYDYCTYVRRTGKVLAVGSDDEFAFGIPCPIMQAGGFVAFLGAPLRDRRGHLRGAVSAVTRADRDWTEAERTAIAALARRVGPMLPDAPPPPPDAALGAH